MNSTRYLVVGAGMMGSAIAFDLSHAGPEDEILLADIDEHAATRVARSIGPNVRPILLDVNNTAALRRALDGVQVVICAVSYSVNLQVSRAALAAGVHMCDLGGNNHVVDAQLDLHKEALTRGITIIPNCGLAPGLAGVLAVHGAAQFDTIDSIALRVGGLPQHPRPPLNYQLAFSAEGLINEYLEPSTVLREGVLTHVESMTEVEKIDFPPPFGTLEAFHTSGGLSLLGQLFEGKIRTLDYKTIRYPGHCEKVKTLLELGFASSEPLIIGGGVRTAREMFTELLRKRLAYGDTDIVLARVTIAGTQDRRASTLVYELIDYYDEGTRLTAMMRTTAFPTAITARMLAQDIITARGVLPPELCTPGHVMIEELRRRNILITERMIDERNA